MEVKCVSINLSYCVTDEDNEQPVYEFIFITTVPHGDYEGLPLIDKLSLIGSRSDMFKIGEYYNFYSYGIGPYETSIYTSPEFREQLNKEDASGL